MSRVRLSAGGILILLAVIPAGLYASLLAGAAEPSAHSAEILRGVWIAKVFLILHAILILALPRLGPGQVDACLIRKQPAAAVSGTAWAILAGLLAAGTALRFYHLGEGLWFDEIQTLVEYARLPLGRIITTFDSQNQHLLYSLTSGLALQLLGESTWVFRLPAAVFGILSLGALFQFARLVTGAREALLATALLTFSYHHVWFSQNARGYTSLLFWSLVGTGLFIRLLRGEHRGWWGPIAYGVSMALAVYTHVTAVLVVIAHAIVFALAWWRARGKPAGMALPALSGLLLAGTISAQLYALVLPQFFTTLLTPTMPGVDTAWKDPFWLVLETLRGLGAGLPGGWATIAAALLVAGAGLWSYARQSPALAALFVLPALLTGIAAVVLGHNLWPRFFFFSAGFAALMAIRGLFTLAGAIRVPRPALSATVAALVMILAGATLLPRAWRPKQDYEGAARYVGQTRHPEDAVVVVDLTRFPYQRYLQQSWSSVDNVKALEEIERLHPNTWVLYTFPIRLAAVHPDIWSRLQSNYRTAAIFPGTIGGGAIVVMVFRPALQPPRSPA